MVDIVREFLMKEFQWTLKLEHIDEVGILQSTVVGFIERPEVTSEADLGLTYADGKYLIRQVQAEIAHHQDAQTLYRSDGADGL